MRYLAVCFGLLFAAGACSDKQTVPVIVEVKAPTLEASPPPGDYVRNEPLAITISSDRPDDEITFSFDATVPGATPFHSGQLQLRLSQSNTISVWVTRERVVFGPYQFNYNFQKIFPVAFCSARLMNGPYLQPGADIRLLVDYSLPTALSRAELRFGDQVEKLPAPEQQFKISNQEITVRISSEGTFPSQCVIVSTSRNDVSEGPTVFIDGTPPVVTWQTPGTVLRSNWMDEFRFETEDLFGVRQAFVCDGAAHCLEVENDIPNEYRFATALTEASRGAGTLFAVAVDLAGNRSAPLPLALDLQAFPAAFSYPTFPIVMTTTPSFNLADHLAEQGHSAPLVAYAGTLATSYSTQALPLVPGWNEWFFRMGVNDAWSSLGVYFAGVAATFPIVGDWLVYASRSTAPAYQAELMASVTNSGRWSHLEFEVPHVFFVRDGNGNGRWDGSDELHVPAGDTFTSSTLQLIGELTLAEVAAAPTSATLTATVTCDECTEPGVLYHERRDSMAAYPGFHGEHNVALPALVEIGYDPGNLCVWFWDENDSGSVDGNEARAIQACATAGVSLRRRSADGLQVVASSSGSRIAGVPYGGSVTRELEVTSLFTDELLLRIAQTPVADTNGFGWFSYPAVEPSAQVWNGRQLYILRSYPSQVTQAWTLSASTLNNTISVTVTDAQSAPVEAVVAQAYADGVVDRFATDNLGEVQLGLRSPPGAAFLYPQRLGYLGSTAWVTGPSDVALVLLPESQAPLLSGVLRDIDGRALAGVGIRFDGTLWRSITQTAADGSYSLPASGPGSLVIEHATLFAPVITVYLGDVSAPGLTTDVTVFVPDHSWGESETSPLVVEDDQSPFSIAQSGNLYAVSTTAGSVTAYWGVTGRRTQLPGLMPGETWAAATGTQIYDDETGLLSLEFWAECGDWQQDAKGEAWVVNSCWSWMASDELQRYYLGGLDPVGGFPRPGFGNVQAAVLTDGTPAIDQTYELCDQLLPRCIKIRSVGGVLDADVPRGIYTLRDGGGATAKTLSETTAFLFVGSGDAEFYTVNF